MFLNPCSNGVMNLMQNDSPTQMKKKKKWTQNKKIFRKPFNCWNLEQWQLFILIHIESCLLFMNIQSAKHIKVEIYIYTQNVETKYHKHIYICKWYFVCLVLDIGGK